MTWYQITWYHLPLLSLTHSVSSLSQNSEETGVGSAASLTKEEEEARQVMKRIIVKCADISNPLRPMHLCREWASRIAREYFTQVRWWSDNRGFFVCSMDWDLIITPPPLPLPSPLSPPHTPFPELPIVR